MIKIHNSYSLSFVKMLQTKTVLYLNYACIFFKFVELIFFFKIKDHMLQKLVYNTPKNYRLFFLSVLFALIFCWIFQKSELCLYFLFLKPFISPTQQLTVLIQIVHCPVGWGCRIHRLFLCRGVRPPPASVLDMTLNNLMVRFQQCWSFREYGVPLHCHRSQVHSGPEW